jgi:hypothetical protein
VYEPKKSPVVLPFSIRKPAEIHKGKSCLPLEFTVVSWLTLPTILASNLYVENNRICLSESRGIKCNDSIWVKLCKKFFGLQKDLFTCFVYDPPENSTLTKRISYEILDLVENDILK